MILYQTILFDIDDTLVDFKGSETASLKNCYRRFFSPLVAEDRFLNDYHRINRVLWQQVEENKISIAAVGSERFKQLADLYEFSFSSEIPQYYEQQLIENSQFIDGAEELLDALLAKQIKIGFLSNGFSHIQRGKYKNLKLSRYSDVLVISEEVGWSKPQPEIFDYILKRMQSTASTTLMVGDSLTSDGEGAYRANMPFCWYNPGKRLSSSPWEPTHVLYDLKDLLALLKSD